MKQFENKVVLITGATSGIGKACAKMFAKENAKVILVGRNIKRGQKIEDEINKTSGNAFFIQCDVSNETQVKNMVCAAVNKYKKVNILFNNAGIMPKSEEIENISFDDWQKTLDINLTGLFLVTKYLKQYLLKEKGVIINNASIAGLQHYASGRSYAYSASKAAVIQFSHQIAKNYAPEGIRVNCIAPGIIDTPILGDRDRKLYAQRVPLKRLGTPDDVAKAVLFLASDSASYLTGTVLPIDGGVSL
ncbi:TPA: SDR family oxidoreductase [Candidatus Galligastranaerophilus gallistercoris]|nr:SDR family oxidoreductase [Candidatus Galligastranaerophilus gallistercoris]